MTDRKPYEALERAKLADPLLPDGYWGSKNPKCPHCGEVCDVEEEGWYRLYEEGEHKVSCPLCDGDFSVTTHVSYSFSTEHQPDAAEIGRAK